MNTQTWTEADFAAAILAADFGRCHECGKSVRVELLIETDNKDFCSETCRDRATAPLVRPQPKRIPGHNWIDGWDV